MRSYWRERECFMGELIVNLWLSARFDVWFYEIIISVSQTLMISNHSLSYEAGNTNIENNYWHFAFREDQKLYQTNNRHRADADKVGTCVGIKLARMHKRTACDVLGVQICCMHLRWWPKFKSFEDRLLFKKIPYEN